MSAHTKGCVFDSEKKVYTLMGDGCAAPGEHEPQAWKHPTFCVTCGGEIVNRNEAHRCDGPTPKEEARLAFVGALYAKAETSHLKRVDALLILQATLAEMLVPAIEGLKMEARAIEPFSIPRRNADLMIEIAEELRAEALQMVDHAMASTSLILVPRMPR